MDVILAIGVPAEALTAEMRDGLPVEAVQITELPARLIRSMDAAIVFSPEYEARVGLVLAAQNRWDGGGGPTPLMFKDGQLWG